LLPPYIYKSAGDPIKSYNDNIPDNIRDLMNTSAKPFIPKQKASQKDQASTNIFINNHNQFINSNLHINGRIYDDIPQENLFSPNNSKADEPFVTQIHSKRATNPCNMSIATRVIDEYDRMDSRYPKSTIASLNLLSDEEIAENCVQLAKDQSTCRLLQKRIEDNQDIILQIFPRVL
jgi:hypothetical protein